MKWDKIVNEFGNEYVFVANDGTQLYFITNKDAPKRKGKEFMFIFTLDSHDTNR